MSQVNIFQDYLPILVVMGITFVMAQMGIMVGMLLKPKNPYKEKLTPWECGIVPDEEADAGKFTVQFYIIAVLFVIFDVETLFLFPWAVVLNKIGIFALIEMVLFIAILLVGYFYAWSKGALEWVE